MRKGLVLWALWLCLAGSGPATTRAADDQEAARARRRTPVVEVFEKCRDAVVNISTTRVIRMRSLGESPFDDIFQFGGPQRDRKVQSVGSGFIVHEAGYIVTNAHVVAQASDVQVTLANKETLAAEIVSVDPEHDLAVLRVQPPSPLPHIRLGRSNDIMTGENVIAIGNPLGLGHTVTSGIVSALDRELQFAQDVTYAGLIQTDAPINPGNSGGPLLNVNGELIGVNTAIRGDAQNIGFAIPVDRIWELLPTLLDIERRQRVRFGLHVSGADTKVVQVTPDSPAAAAGLRAGDRILRFNGEKLTNGIDYYVHLLGQKPGAQVKLDVERGDEKLNVTVAVQEIPMPDGRALARKLFGIDLQEITADLRSSYGLPATVGLVVQRIERGTPAERARMKPSDLILRLNRVSVTTLNDVGLALEQVQPGQQVVVEGLRIDVDQPFLWTVTIRTRSEEPGSTSPPPKAKAPASGAPARRSASERR
jgi:serine protease Do